jgi:hypothetical protein
MNACRNSHRFRTPFRVLKKRGITMPCTRTGIPLHSIPAGDGRRYECKNVDTIAICLIEPYYPSGGYQDDE